MYSTCTYIYSCTNIVDSGDFNNREPIVILNIYVYLLTPFCKIHAIKNKVARKFYFYSFDRTTSILTKNILKPGGAGCIYLHGLHCADTRLTCTCSTVSSWLTKGIDSFLAAEGTYNKKDKNIFLENRAL